jgi:exopolyphosphatase / guanosine-5'-triphosphate,3'-diphosphate pyrophosphatase
VVVAVVDIGTNSTRLLIAEVGERVTELERRSEVTRLGEGVDGSGRLAEAAQERVARVLGAYAEAIEAHACRRRLAVLTSAVRDAENGAAFAERVRQRYGLDARTLSGDEEAALTFRGATALRRDDRELLVADVGGGSTELVVGARGEVRRHASTQIGVVRHTERHLHADPPTAEQLAALAEDVRANLKGTVPFKFAEAMVAVAGTPTQCAAIDLGLERYDAARVEGHVLTRERLAAILGRLAAVPLAERQAIRGLDPARAPVIVAGVVILLEVLDRFSLDRLEVSERDILWGVALSSAAAT